MEDLEGDAAHTLTNIQESMEVLVDLMAEMENAEIMMDIMMERLYTDLILINLKLRLIVLMAAKAREPLRDILKKVPVLYMPAVAAEGHMACIVMDHCTMEELVEEDVGKACIQM